MDKLAGAGVLLILAGLFAPFLVDALIRLIWMMSPWLLAPLVVCVGLGVASLE